MNEEIHVSTGVLARQCATELLHAVLDEKRPLDEVLARHARFRALPDRDRAFARLLVMTVLRRKGQIDALLATLLAKPLTGKSQDVMHCLRLGAAQLIWLKTPPHAAVHAMVEVVAAMGHLRMKGVVNAVLQRLTREGEAFTQTQDAAKLNWPAWLFTALSDAYGEPMARAMAEVALAEPPLDLTVKSDPEGWAQKLGGIVLPTGSVRLREAGRIEALAGYAEGEWWVQDTAASLPVKLLGEVRDLRVLDLCAAPGGKTAQLAVAGAQVTAVDKSARRLEVLKENLARLRLAAEIVEADILTFKPQAEYDAILLDAPCTATGTLRRHPEVAWHKTPADAQELARAQSRLLRRAAGWLKPGGKLLYCVCSLLPEESEAQARSFTAAHRDFSAVAAPPSWKGLKWLDKEGALRTHPALLAAEGGTDGFYAICWQRLNNI